MPYDDAGGFINVIRKELFCTLEIHGSINKKLFYLLRRSLEEQIDYYKYRFIHLYIESPGGDIAIMSQMLDILRKYTKLGVCFRTVAGSEVASAAAIVFSLGQINFRRISSYSKIVYHLTRTQLQLPEKKYYTAKELELLTTQVNSISSSLNRADLDIAKTLAVHLYQAYDSLAKSPRELVIDFQKRFRFIYSNYLTRSFFDDQSSPQFNLSLHALLNLVTLMDCEKEFLDTLNVFFKSDVFLNTMDDENSFIFVGIFDSLHKNESSWNLYFSRIPDLFDEFFWRSIDYPDTFDSRIVRFSRSRAEDYDDSSWIRNYFHLIYSRIIDNPSDTPINPVLAQLVFLADELDWPDVSQAFK